MAGDREDFAVRPAGFLSLARWEVRRLTAERMGVMLIVLWSGLLAIAAYQGWDAAHTQHSQIAKARSTDAENWSKKRTLLIEINAGLREPEPFADPRSPTQSVMGRGGEGPVVLTPTPLAALSGGSGDLAPPVLPTGMITKLIGPAQSIENPANRLAGPLDLAFVVSALLPLFVLALSFDVLARERDADIWPLLASQPTPAGRIMAARLAVHFVVLWLPLVVAAGGATAASAAADASFAALATEVGLWSILAALYLIFWQLLAAVLNFQQRSAASNAILLAGAWLASVLLIPSLVGAVVQTVAPPPDRRDFLLEVRQVETELFERADELREAYYAAHPEQRPAAELSEYDAYYVGNLYPRILAADDALAPTLNRLNKERTAQDKWWRRLSWLSPTLAFRLSTEQLAGVTPSQRSMLVERAKTFQREMRAAYGFHVASMTPLTAEDYDRRPSPPTIELPLSTRLRRAFPGLIGVVTASLILGLWLGKARRHAREGVSS